MTFRVAQLTKHTTQEPRRSSARSVHTKNCGRSKNAKEGCERLSTTLFDCDVINAHTKTFTRDKSTINSNAKRLFFVKSQASEVRSVLQSFPDMVPENKDFDFIFSALSLNSRVNITVPKTAVRCEGIYNLSCRGVRPVTQAERAPPFRDRPPLPHIRRQSRVQP